VSSFYKQISSDKNEFNELQTDTVEFLVYDHYGRPQFEKYISFYKEDGNFYLQKYQFDPVKDQKMEIGKY